MTQTPVRKAFLVANTYSDPEFGLKLKPLPGTQSSVQAVKTALDRQGFQSTVALDQTTETLKRDLAAWVKDSHKADAALFYFCGHGDYYAVESTTEDVDMDTQYITHRFTGTGGEIALGGDVIKDNQNNFMFKDRIMQILYKGISHQTHVIAIFDCCRGTNNLEMALIDPKPQPEPQPKPAFRLKVLCPELAQLKNSNYKNSYIFHATLPHQVAWCEKDPLAGTKFSKYFLLALSENPPVSVNVLDEFINSKLDEEKGVDTRGHKQMVQLVKMITKPFVW